MDLSIIEKYFNKNKSKVFALRNFLTLKNKDISLKDALIAILDACDGNFDEANSLIDTLSAKNKTYGRSQVYGSDYSSNIDIVKDSNGTISIVGYNKSLPNIEKGKKDNPNPLKYKNSGEKRVDYEKTVNKVYDVGKVLKNEYPDTTSDDIYQMIKIVRDYASRKKKSIYLVLDKIKAGKLKFLKSEDETWKLVSKMNEKKVIILKNLSIIKESYEPLTFYHFQYLIKSFLSDLLNDPVHTSLPIDLVNKGLNKKQVLSYMINHYIIEKDSSIVDKDENGNPLKPSMNVKYKVPKVDFERKIKKMFIYFFEKNLPSTISEDGMAGATSANISADASFVQPVFGIQRRKLGK